MAGKRSIRADQVPPRKIKSAKQMIDIAGFPLSTEQGAPLVTEKEVYPSSEYGEKSATSVVLDSDSYKESAKSTSNKFSKGGPASLPVIEQFPEQSEVSKSLLGIDRQTSQQGLFSNVSTYGLDPKDWKVETVQSIDDSNRWWWTRRPSSSGNYYPIKFLEDYKNSALTLISNPTPFLEPVRPSVQDQLTGVDTNYVSWGQYINSVVAMYLVKYMVKNFTKEQWNEFNLLPMLGKFPPILNQDGTSSFNDLYWDKIWLDIQQSRFGPESNYPIIPRGKAYNFDNVSIDGWRSNSSLWGSSSVFITEAEQNLPEDLNVSWNNFFFSTTRMYFPSTDDPENKGHFKIKTNPVSDIWEKYHGIRWENVRPDLKAWEFTVHSSVSSVTQLEKDLKLPYFVLDNPIIPDRINNIFSNLWPSQSFGQQINLPVNSNRIGGEQGIYSEITLKSVRAFRYQPGRISGFTYGVKVSEIGAGPGTVIEFGVENPTDSYMFRLTNGSLFSIVRRSTIPLENSQYLNYSNSNTVVRNNITQYETVIEQKEMNGDGLGGEGKTAYLLNPDTVTMYKIEFGWYGAIGARFYAYVPVGSGECRWVVMHTLIIENQLSKPCLADPFFYFKYRLKVEDSSAIRINQYISKFGASYYIDGYDEGTVYPLNSQSKVRYLSSPNFSESKTRLNAIDWVTVTGIKPRRYLTNRYGNTIFNKKEIFPEKLSVISQQDCEIKIVRQKGCPEWAFSHQEGYIWTELPNNRRLKAKFNISPYYQLDFPELGITSTDPQSHTAVMALSQQITGGFRDPSLESNWSGIGNQAIRLLGQDLYGLNVAQQKYFNPSLNSVSLKLIRASKFNYVLSSRTPVPISKKVYLPFTYPSIPPYTDGYEVELDYFRRDQILLSTVNILSDEFYILWTGGELSSIIPDHISSFRFGIAWPDLSNPSSPLYTTTFSDSWGIQTNPTYDLNSFYEGLPYNLPQDYPQNTLYVETGVLPYTNTYNFESGEVSDYNWTDIDYNLGVIPGSEGGYCHGLYCKSGREVRSEVSIVSETDQNTSITTYYISDTTTPWPNLSPSTYTVTVTQGSTVQNITTTGGITRVTENIIQYLLPIGTSLPSGISSGAVSVSFNTIYIASMDKEFKVKTILASKISPGNTPFLRAFVQGRQGAKIGGVWIGQKTQTGVKVEPFTPHRCTLSISDSGAADYHGQWSTPPQSSGPTKVIKTYTTNDTLGYSTAPTINPQENSLDTNKSIHSSKKKCGSFLSSGSVNSAGIFTPSDYPIRWLTSGEGSALANYYISANTPTEIDLRSVFNIHGESIINDDDANLATFFIARSLNNHNELQNEIYLSLNYSEQ